MKFIHTADVHLGASLSAHFTSEQARRRRGELLNTFVRMTDYASSVQAAGILISGDLFDTKSVSAHDRNTVTQCIRSHPEILFFYLRGNHDAAGFFDAGEEKPDNLKTFGTEWTCCRIGGITVSGIELDRSNSAEAAGALICDPEQFNIVMMHGQTSDYETDRKAENINLTVYRNKGIDYLALGHIHGHREGRLDARGYWAYPGCLEGRGFDECGAHGFIELEIDPESGRFTRNFMPFAKRELHEIRTDVTGCTASMEMIRRVEALPAYEALSEDDLVRIVLVGKTDAEAEKNPAFMETHFKELFFYAEVRDCTETAIDASDYSHDRTLKGEFVRTVMAEPGLSDEEKAQIIRYGFQCLAGEEPEL